MTKIFVLKPHEKWSYNAGDVGLVPDEAAQTMVKIGYWKKVEDEQKQTTDNDTSKRKRGNSRAGKIPSKD